MTLNPPKNDDAGQKLLNVKRSIALTRIENMRRHEEESPTAVSIGQIMNKKNPGGTISSRGIGGSKSPSSPTTGSGIRPIIPLSR